MCSASPGIPVQALAQVALAQASQKSLAAQAVEEEASALDCLVSTVEGGRNIEDKTTGQAQKALADVEALRKQRQRLQEQLQARASGTLGFHIDFTCFSCRQGQGRQGPNFSAASR